MEVLEQKNKKVTEEKRDNNYKKQTKYISKWKHLILTLVAVRILLQGGFGDL